MAAALSQDLRPRVIATIEAGASCRQAAERFGVGKASAIRWHTRYQAEGAVAAKPMGRDPHSHRSGSLAALILQTLEERSQVYLRELRYTLQDHGAAVSLSGLSRFFRRHGISRKKGRSTRPSSIART